MMSKYCIRIPEVLFGNRKLIEETIGGWVNGANCEVVCKVDVILELVRGKKDLFLLIKRKRKNK